MTSFKNLFKVMQVPKLKNASLVYLLQVIGMIAIGSFLFFNDHLSSLAEGFFLAEFITLFFTGLFLYFYLLYKEIKSYESQTWQLMPISSAKFYLTNQLYDFNRNLFSISCNQFCSNDYSSGYDISGNY